MMKLSERIRNIRSFFPEWADEVAQLEEENKEREKQLKWEKALTVAHSNKIDWLKRVINVMLPLTPFADAEDALLKAKEK